MSWLTQWDLSAFTGAREKCAGMVRLTGVRAAGGWVHGRRVAADGWREAGGDGRKAGRGKEASLQWYVPLHNIIKT